MLLLFYRSLLYETSHAYQRQTSSGQCLAVDELSGDFRANLTPIKVAACDGSTGQQWDIITKGKHNNVAESMLVVNTLVSLPHQLRITY
jgi:hypothetical protein